MTDNKDEYFYQFQYSNGPKPEDYYGKKIVKCYFEYEYEYDDNKQGIHIEFDDGVKIFLLDDGQSCCESRYITCDDNPEDLNGQILKEISLMYVDDPRTEEEIGYGDLHEKCFVKIQTDKDSITLCTHNEHNGYYGGFSFKIREGK